MIKATDKKGSLIVLSCYLLLIPVSVLAIFAIVPFIFGVVVSTQGLVQHKNQKWVGIYMTIASGLLFSIFPLLQFFGLWGIAIIYIIPAVVASSSLIMAHITNEESNKLTH